MRGISTQDMRYIVLSAQPYTGLYNRGFTQEHTKFKPFYVSFSICGVSQGLIIFSFIYGWRSTITSLVRATAILHSLFAFYCTLKLQYVLYV